MTSPALDALAQRIAAARQTLEPGTDLGEGGDDYLSQVLGLAAAARRTRHTSAAWLLLVALTGAQPDQALVRSVTRQLELKDPEDFVVWVLSASLPLAARSGNAEAVMRVVTDRPVVDVNFTAKSDFLTGIQRVVRRVVQEWTKRHDVELVVWTNRGGAYRSLQPQESTRLLEPDARAYRPGADAAAVDGREIVVPWGVPVVLIEVPDEAQSDRLAAVAELTRSTVRLVGHDCIPMASAETVSLVEPEKFGRYLELVKHATRVAGVSRSAADEFAGFVRALGAQGLRGPDVTSCPLPHTSPLALSSQALATPGSGGEDTGPLVVSIGSVGRRKNQVVLVEAAEVLWREGLDFTVMILGHVGGERTPLSGLVPELQEGGRKLVVRSGMSDAAIASELARARCLVFPSLHEGFGLPLVEALSQGVPVITSDFGSAREIAEGNGGLLVDPMDVSAVVDALRSLLTDDDLHAGLVREAQARPIRTWADYAGELWEDLCR